MLGIRLIGTTSTCLTQPATSEFLVYAAKLLSTTLEGLVKRQPVSQPPVPETTGFKPGAVRIWAVSQTAVQIREPPIARWKTPVESRPVTNVRCLAGTCHTLGIRLPTASAEHVPAGGHQVDSAAGHRPKRLFTYLSAQSDANHCRSRHVESAHRTSIPSFSVERAELHFEHRPPRKYLSTRISKVERIVPHFAEESASDCNP